MQSIEDIIRNIDRSNLDVLAKATHSIGPDYDYKYANGVDGREHYTDKGKLPWHKTFSNESVYDSAEYPGGQMGRRQL